MASASICPRRNNGDVARCLLRAEVPGSSSRSACTHIPVGRAFRRVGRAEMGGFARPTAICVRASSRPHPYARRPGVSRRRSQAALRRIFAGGSLVCSPFFTLVHSSRTISARYLTILSNADKRPANSRIVIMKKWLNCHFGVENRLTGLQTQDVGIRGWHFYKMFAGRIATTSGLGGSPRFRLVSLLMCSTRSRSA